LFGLTYVSFAGESLVALDALVRVNVSSLAQLAEAWDGKVDPEIGGGENSHEEAGDGPLGNPLYLALFQDCIMPESKMQPCLVSRLRRFFVS
jgi:hypothetical protein